MDVDLPALDHNLGIVRSNLPANCRVGLVAKADAYGHGLVPVARYASQGAADWICVATVQEGLALRDAGVATPTLVLSPILPVEAEQAVFYDLRVTVERVETARALSEAAVHQEKTAKIHLEVDTGLARFGCAPQEAAEVAEAIRALPNVHLEGISQHFVDSGHSPARTEEQAGVFGSLAADFEDVLRHGCNSAGVFRCPQARLDMVRVGILAYGVDPYGLAPGQSRPMLTWKARVTALREIAAGASVSYSETWRASRRTVVATLGVGYGDGYPRALSSKGVVLAHGQELPVIGLVCMDQILIDATDAPSLQIGDEATLIGGSVTVERLAQLAGTNCHEITTRIMSRVPRRYRWS